MPLLLRLTRCRGAVGARNLTCTPHKFLALSARLKTGFFEKGRAVRHSPPPPDAPRDAPPSSTNPLQRSRESQELSRLHPPIKRWRLTRTCTPHKFLALSARLKTGFFEKGRAVRHSPPPPDAPRDAPPSSTNPLQRSRESQELSRLHPPIKRWRLTRTCTPHKFLALSARLKTGFFEKGRTVRHSPPSPDAPRDAPPSSTNPLQRSRESQELSRLHPPIKRWRLTRTCTPHKFLALSARLKTGFFEKGRAVRHSPPPPDAPRDAPPSSTNPLQRSRESQELVSFVCPLRHHSYLVCRKFLSEGGGHREGVQGRKASRLHPPIKRWRLTRTCTPHKFLALSARLKTGFFEKGRAVRHSPPPPDAPRDAPPSSTNPLQRSRESQELSRLHPPIKRWRLTRTCTPHKFLALSARLKTGFFEKGRAVRHSPPPPDAPRDAPPSSTNPLQRSRGSQELVSFVCPLRHHSYLVCRKFLSEGGGHREGVQGRKASRLHPPIKRWRLTRTCTPHKFLALSARLKTGFFEKGRAVRHSPPPPDAPRDAPPSSTNPLQRSRESQELVSFVCPLRHHSYLVCRKFLSEGGGHREGVQGRKAVP
ncbi:Rho GTPase-activating protein 6 [Sarotherodon galilaeus]